MPSATNRRCFSKARERGLQPDSEDRTRGLQPDSGEDEVGDVCEPPLEPVDPAVRETQLLAELSGIRQRRSAIRSARTACKVYSA